MPNVNLRALSEQEIARAEEVKEALFARHGQTISEDLLRAADVTWSLRNMIQLLNMAGITLDQCKDIADAAVTGSAWMSYETLSLHWQQIHGLLPTQAQFEAWEKEIETLCNHLYASEKTINEAARKGS